MLLCILLDFFQMLVVAVFRQPADNVAMGPINLKSVRVLVVDVILIKICDSGIYQDVERCHSRQWASGQHGRVSQCQILEQGHRMRHPKHQQPSLDG